MPAVFVHGVPDTYHVWEPLLEHLSRKDIHTLALPGFGTSIPHGVRAIKEMYVDWIIAQLEAFTQPVDLVGHDWGCLLTMRVASLRPDLVRSWAAGSGPVSAIYEWHPLAKIWQTSGAGEKWMMDLNPSDLAAFMEKAGLPSDRGKEAADRIDDTMKQSILQLYRSAVNVGAEWQPGLKNASSPGLVFWGEQDLACPVTFAHELGRDAAAKRVITFESGHWVIVQRPAEVAQALEAHWKSLTVYLEELSP